MPFLVHMSEGLCHDFTVFSLLAVSGIMGKILSVLGIEVYFVKVF